MACSGRESLRPPDDHGGTLPLINGVVAGIGGVFLVTGSMPVTAIAAVVAAVIGVAAVVTGR